MSWLKKLHDWCNRHEWILLLLLLVVILRIPSLFTPHYYGDEEIYFVMGRAWREGLPLYKAMFDHKPPLIYILAGIANTVFLFRGALMVAMMAHTVLFWKLARKFWAGKARLLPYLSSLIFVVLTTLPTFEGLITNAELLMMLPVTLSLLLVWDAKSNEWGRFLIAGLVAGIGWLFKVPVVTDVAAIALYLFAFRKPTFWESVKGIFSWSFLAYAGGFALPLAATFVYYYLKGSGPDYLGTVVTMNLGYVSSWSTNTYKFNPLKSGLMIRTVLLGTFTLVVYLLRKKLDKRLVLAALWFAFSFYGALLSDRPYPHYLQEAVPAFSLLLPCIFIMENIWSWGVFAVLLAAGIAAEVQIKFWGYPILPVYQSFYQLETGKISQEQYIAKFDGAARDYKIAEYLAAHLGVKDQIYVWSTDPSVYNLTERVPTGGKYIVSFHVRDLHQYSYTMSNLEKNQPKYILMYPEGGEFPELSAYLADQYLRTATIEGVDVYMRIGK